MPILKDTTAPNGAAVGFHKATKADVDLRTGLAMVQVHSWPTEAAHNAGLGIAWAWPVRLTAADLADVDAALVAQVDGVFLGGSVVPDESESQDALKARKWAQIKAARDAAEFGGFEWGGFVFDSDPVSQSRIQGAAQLATLAMLASEPFSVDWTMADNSVHTLSGGDMLAAGQAMGVHIMTVHGIGRALRAAVDAATTTEELGAIAWPT